MFRNIALLTHFLRQRFFYILQWIEEPSVHKLFRSRATVVYKLSLPCRPASCEKCAATSHRILIIVRQKLSLGRAHTHHTILSTLYLVALCMSSCLFILPSWDINYHCWMFSLETFYPNRCNYLKHMCKILSRQCYQPECKEKNSRCYSWSAHHISTKNKLSTYFWIGIRLRLSVIMINFEDVRVGESFIFRKKFLHKRWQ